MKKLFFCLFVLVHYTLNAQINLENAYTDGYVLRVDLANSGEKYYLLDAQNAVAKFYNANHTLWKTINLSIPTGATINAINHVSENVINSDNLLEVGYTFFTNSGGLIYESRIINEAGTTLLSIPNASSIFVSQMGGLQDKIIATIQGATISSEVYGIPSLALEHTYTDGYVSRIDLANSGEKYYLLDAQNAAAKLYNADYTFWKSINLPIPVGAIINGINHVSENVINSDNLLEVGYTFFTNGTGLVYESRIINEAGTTLLSIPNASSIFVSQMGGLQDKIIATIHGATTSSKVYGIPSLALEHTYTDGYVLRVDLANLGEKYYFLDAPNATAKFYNANHTLWKTITLPTTTGATISGINHVSNNVINSDNLVEIGYTFFTNNGGLVYESRIINETGTTLLSIPNASSAFVSEIGGLQNKIIAAIQGTTLSSEVYGIPSFATSVLGIDSDVSLSIYPNPTIHFLTIDNRGIGIKDMNLVSSNGEIVKSIQSPRQKTVVDLNDLPIGVYFLIGKDQKGNVFSKKLVKQSF
ncbi:T9SS type A sorting domain-containing protein [Aureispira sp. CCB-E]|uniref:T9SS type A sorting domain-containing protein n=1 Tax=Aureispira sp. CCB-E TaxID=3051121 RepID=UPI002868B74E|nr:T9SS type A sorting domain-containing protein [Aureispira sp. CCB-E]WMX17003.1 T9SS type A sorting domain-containing protein [Aureispira sp. CCB-E]